MKEMTTRTIGVEIDTKKPGWRVFADILLASPDL